MVTRKLYERVHKEGTQFFASLKQLTDSEDKIYGLTHNDLDLDEIIDTLDYCTNDVDFDEYKRLMKEAKKERKRESTGRYGFD